MIVIAGDVAGVAVQMLSPRPSLCAAPSIWKLEVETPQRKPGPVVTGTCAPLRKLVMGIAVICLYRARARRLNSGGHNARLRHPALDRDQDEAGSPR
jgi:hypothetical protein